MLKKKTAPTFSSLFLGPLTAALIVDLNSPFITESCHLWLESPSKTGTANFQKCRHCFLFCLAWLWRLRSTWGVQSQTELPLPLPPPLPPGNETITRVFFCFYFCLSPLSLSPHFPLLSKERKLLHEEWNSSIILWLGWLLQKLLLSGHKKWHWSERSRPWGVLFIALQWVTTACMGYSSLSSVKLCPQRAAPGSSSLQLWVPVALLPSQLQQCLLSSPRAVSHKFRSWFSVLCSCCQTLPSAQSSRKDVALFKSPGKSWKQSGS